METAFEMMIKEPLARLNVQQPVIILLDALDEADPIEQQAPGFNGDIKVCGNKTLQLLRLHLVQLGANVRFICTTRPDALMNDVERVLTTTFGGSLDLVRKPSELRRGFKKSSDDATDLKAGVMVYHTVVDAMHLTG